MKKNYQYPVSTVISIQMTTTLCASKIEVVPGTFEDENLIY